MLVRAAVSEAWLERGRGMGKGEVGGERGERNEERGAAREQEAKERQERQESKRARSHGQPLLLLYSLLLSAFLCLYYSLNSPPHALNKLYTVPSCTWSLRGGGVQTEYQQQFHGI